MSETIKETLTRLRSRLPKYTDEEIETARRRTLAQGGLSCNCGECGGLALVRYDVPRDDWRFGKLFPCRNAPPESLRAIGGFGLFFDEQKNLTWADVLDFGNSKEAARQVRQVLGKGYGWVYLWGEYGTAKTLILKIAVAESLRSGTHAAYVRMVDLLDDLRDTFNGEARMTERVAYWTSIPVLAIDEIDRFKQTEWAQERLFQIIDRRYSGSLVERQVTLIASNVSPEALGATKDGRVDGYLASRIRDGRFSVVRLDGGDMRPGMVDSGRADFDEIERQHLDSVFDTGERI